MESINIVNVLFGFFEVLASFMNEAAKILFQEINILGHNFQLFYLLGGGVFIVLMVLWLIKHFI